MITAVANQARIQIYIAPIRDDGMLFAFIFYTHDKISEKFFIMDITKNLRAVFSQNESKVLYLLSPFFFIAILRINTRNVLYR